MSQDCLVTKLRLNHQPLPARLWKFPKTRVVVCFQQSEPLEERLKPQYCVHQAWAFFGRFLIGLVQMGSANFPFFPFFFFAFLCFSSLFFVSLRFSLILLEDKGKRQQFTTKMVVHTQPWAFFSHRPPD